MPKPGRHRRGGRTTPKGGRPDAQHRAAEPDLLVDVRQAMREDHPLGLLARASSIINAFDPRNENPFERRPAPGLGWEGLLASFLDADLPETTGLLVAIAAMTADQLVAARIGKAVAARAHRLPPWLEGLDEIHVTKTIEMVEPLGDGDNVIVGARLPTGAELTVFVYIDHNLGTVAKDAFIVPEAIDNVLTMAQRNAADPDIVCNDLEQADARARIAEAIALGAMTVPPFASDSWPACRPLVEWIARSLPDGGAGYERPEWDDDALDALADRFFESTLGRDLDDEDHRDVLDHLLWFGSGYGPGDPLRWSPVAVELLLADWVPRKIIAPADHLAKVPEVLRPFIRFCHTERGIRRDLTEATLAAVDQWEPEYQRIIRSPRLQGPQALLAAAGIDVDDLGGLEDDLRPYREVMLDSLRAAVGGDDALRHLDDGPLPDEEFRWDEVPADIRPPVAEVLALCDGWCDAVFDVEHRTACRRFLARVAVTDPSVFRRRSRPATAAAGVCWAVGQANRSLSTGPGTYVKDLVAHMGVTPGAPADRGRTLLRAGGFGHEYCGDIYLGTPDLLVAARRRRIVDQRDRYLALDDDW